MPPSPSPTAPPLPPPPMPMQVSGAVMGVLLMRAAIAPDELVSVGSWAMPVLRVALMHAALDVGSNALPNSVGVDKLFSWVGAAVAVAATRPQVGSSCTHFASAPPPPPPHPHPVPTPPTSRRSVRPPSPCLTPHLSPIRARAFSSETWSKRVVGKVYSTTSGVPYKPSPGPPCEQLWACEQTSAPGWRFLTDAGRNGSLRSAA